MDSHIRSVVDQHAEHAVENKLTSEAKSALLPVGRAASDDGKVEQAIIVESYPANDMVQAVMDHFSRWFKPQAIQRLGLPRIIKQNGAWYFPWDSGSYQAQLEPETMLGDAKQYRPSYRDIAQQSFNELMTYLTNKFSRREDSSLFAKTYKTLLAKLCHKCIERIEYLSNKTWQCQYYQSLTGFMDSVWSDDQLINPRLYHDRRHVHIEHFLRKVMALCASRHLTLRIRQPQNELADWIGTLDQELAACHILGARVFHYMVQGQAVPANLDGQLRQCGNTYHRLWLAQCAIASEDVLPLRFKAKRMTVWQRLADQVQAIVKSIGINCSASIPSITTLWPLVLAKKITLQQAIFIDVGDYLSADQSLYLALYQPDALAMSEGDKAKFFGTTAFLQLYRTEQEVMGFQWLRWHIQQASDQLLPALTALDRMRDDTSAEFKQQLMTLVKQVRQLCQDDVYCPSIASVSSIGILPVLENQLIQQPHYPKGLIDDISVFLMSVQQQLHRLVLIRALLGQYRAIVPQVGELIAALALRQDLSVIAHLVKQVIDELQYQLAGLLPLQGWGYHMSLNTSQQLCVTKKHCCLEVIDSLVKLPPTLKIWRLHKPLREKALEALSARLSLCNALLNQLHAKIEPVRLAHLMKKTQRRFQLARLLLMTGFANNISPEQQAGLKSGDRMMSQWLSIVDSGIAQVVSEDKRKPVVATLGAEDIMHQRLNQDAKQRVLSQTLTAAGETANVNRLSRVICSSAIAATQSTQAPGARDKGAGPIQSSNELKHNSLDQQSTSINAYAISATALKPLLTVLKSIIDRSVALLQMNPNATAITLYDSWQQLLLNQQEVFFQIFSQVRSQYQDDRWSVFFQQQLGMRYWPLPQSDKPAGFFGSWWKRHTIEDRQLFFKTLCFSMLSKTMYPDGISRNLNVLQHWQTMLQYGADELCVTQQPSWFDKVFEKWRCYLPGKRVNCYQHLNTLAASIEQLQVRSAMRQKHSDVSDDGTLNETKVILGSDINAGNTHLHQCPFELTPGTPAWQQYSRHVKQQDTKQKQQLCLHFFSAALFRIQSNVLSIAANSQDARCCQQLIQLFWVGFNGDPALSTSPLCSALSSLHQHFESNQIKASVKQYYFIWEARQQLAEHKKTISVPSSSKDGFLVV